ncbi:unnamed protein product [Amoebophrya sp. A120]|nr:unnamed protein product [Amoebophrya sp. A120]|eukprot:GSA120T00005933001.1
MLRNRGPGKGRKVRQWNSTVHGETVQMDFEKDLISAGVRLREADAILMLAPPVYSIFTLALQPFVAVVPTRRLLISKNIMGESVRCKATHCRRTSGVDDSGDHPLQHRSNETWLVFSFLTLWWNTTLKQKQK